MISRSTTDTNYSLDIDLKAQTVIDNSGFTASFEIDPFRKRCILNGLDDIGLTLRFEDKITVYEDRHPETR